MQTINERSLVNFVFSYYHETLTRSQRARRFLNAIGFGTPRLINELYLGFADRTLGLQLPEDNTASGAAVRGTLRRMGLLKPSGHEHLRGCVIFPLQDAAGDIMGGYAFRLDAYEKSRRIKPVSWVLDRPCGAR